MKKKSLIIVLALFFIEIMSAQSSIAILKFQDAEEAFFKEDFPTAISKLDEAEKILGKINTSKVLYLRIMAESKLLENQNDVDIENIALFRKKCNFYLNEFEKNSGLEEKYKDVYRIAEKYKEFEPFDKIIKGAKEGKVDDMFKLGVAYQNVYNTEKTIEWLTKAADKNYALALTFLGKIYQNLTVLNVKKNNANALELLNKASKQNDPRALASLSIMYKSGFEGIKKDSLVAANYAEKSLSYSKTEADKGNVYYIYYFGSLQKNSAIKKVDYEMALYWYKKAIEKGSGDAASDIGDMYSYGQGVEKNYNKAISFYKIAIEKGYFLAMQKIAALYRKKDFKDDQKAIEWYTKAAEKGNTDAMSALGYGYSNNYFGANDAELAIKWSLKAANKGDQTCINNMGNIYRYGWGGIEKNSKTAREWFLKGAEKEYSSSYKHLGDLSYSGEGVPKDYQEAIKWYIKATEVDNSIFSTYLFDIGNVYKNDLKDYLKAIEWYNKSINRRYLWAALPLAEIYYQGLGVKRDYAKAFQLYLKAAESGYSKEATQWVAIMYKEGKGVEKDKKLAAEWQAKYEAAKSKE